jgi:hypothetical protein
MVRRPLPTPTEDAPDQTDDSPSTGVSGFRALLSGEPDLATLPIIGITRRRMAIVLGALLAGWIVIVFARQVSEASAATGRAEAMVLANAQQRAANAGLERELAQIQEGRFVLQQARGYGLGAAKEVAFTLDSGAPPLDAHAPGSAALRVGAPTSVSPLERWLTLLFGPGD